VTPNGSDFWRAVSTINVQLFRCVFDFHGFFSHGLVAWWLLNCLKALEILIPDRDGLSLKANES
jgi:hypothetical protein